MTCAEFEILLCDYMDGTLDAARKQALELHRDQCSSCAELAQDVTGAMRFIERTEEVAVPPELLTRIAFEIPTGKQKRREGLLSGLGKMVPAGTAAEVRHGHGDDDTCRSRCSGVSRGSKCAS